MAKQRSFIERWSEAVVKKTVFLWLPFVALNKIIKKIRKGKST